MILNKEETKQFVNYFLKKRKELKRGFVNES